LFLEENNYPQHYRDLIGTKSTSDNEVDSSGLKANGQPVHLIKKRRERSVQFEIWIRCLDEQREQDARYGGKRWRERSRIVPVNQQPSDFPALPEGMPINYFAPDFYNGLQPRLRDHITNTKVALLPNVTKSFLCSADERLSDKQFNVKYGEQVLARYQLMEEGELEDVEEEDWLADDDKDAEMLEGDEEDMYDGVKLDVDMSDRQQSLAAQLSLESL
jgi:hypothetical protein